MLEFVLWKWTPVDGYRSKYDSMIVNIAMSMLERHMTVPFRLTCITDDPIGISSTVRVLPIWDLHPRIRTLARIVNPSNPRNPGCYARLYIYSEDARRTIGERICSIDADFVLLRDLAPWFSGNEDFWIWGGQEIQPGLPQVYCWYNGSVQYVRAGTRTKVWDDFNPDYSPQLAHRAKCRGSDQGWIAYCLGHKEKTIGTSDGIYSYKNHVLRSGGDPDRSARFIAFHGKHDPWHADVRAKHAWVREHYR